MGQLFSWGENKMGQLGLGHTMQMKKPQRVIFDSKGNQCVVEVACGSMHSHLVTSERKFYSCGFNKAFQLCLGTDCNSWKFVESEMVTEIIQRKHSVLWLECGVSHSGILVDGEIFLWGMPLKDKTLILKTPQRFSMENKRINRINLGQFVTWIVASESEVYELSQINQNLHKTKNELVFRLVFQLEKISFFFSGLSHCIFGDENRIFAYGSNAFSQFGNWFRKSLVSPP